MAKDAKSWPDKPGFPMNPGKSGWHWLSWQGGEPRAWEYDAELNPYGMWRSDEGSLGAWLCHETARYGSSGIQTPNYMVSNGWLYLGPCLPPEAINELLEALRDLVPIVDTCNSWHREAQARARAVLAKATGG